VFAKGLPAHAITTPFARRHCREAVLSLAGKNIDVKQAFAHRNRIGAWIMAGGETDQGTQISSEHRFRLLVEGVTDYAICLLDPSGFIASWNAGAQRITGYTEGEIVGQHFSQFYTREDRVLGMPLRALGSAVRNGRYEQEGWRVRKDGSRFRASVVLDAIRGGNGELLGFAKITRDVTERQTAQEALRDSERQLRLLIAGVTGQALYMLDPDGFVSSWNAGAERIKGYRSEEIIGQHFSRFYTDEDRAAGAPARALRTASQEQRYEAENWRMRKDGTLFWAHVIIEAIRDEDGELVGFAKITRDNTERRDAQLALQRTREQLAHAQRMEALGQLTGGVAHDFNNLLMIVSGHLQILKRAIEHDPRSLRSAEAIEHAVQRGEALTRRLLAFSRRQRLNPEPIRLQQRIEALCGLLSKSLPENIEVRVGSLEDVWPIEIDVSELELALMNVVINARDAMSEGGTITLTAANVALRHGERDLELEGDFVALTVSDTGPGIQDDVLPKVFDPFFTTKPADQGTGLGLSQVHGFAHQSGGTVTISTRPGHGTSVTLYLPRTLGDPRDADDASQCGRIVGGRVLVAEDNQEIALVNAALLEQLGYQSTIVNSAEAALDRLDASEAFDLVFSDIVMAGQMDGIALARVLRERYPELPVLLTTGYSRSVESAPPDLRILRKPYQLPELRQAVAQVIARRTEQAHDPQPVAFSRRRRAAH
jgi:PAS domain S-box-containing protein